MPSGFLALASATHPLPAPSGFLSNVSSLLAASVFHFNEISIKDVKIFLDKENIKVRL